MEGNIISIGACQEALTRFYPEAKCLQCDNGKVACEHELKEKHEYCSHNQISEHD